MWVVGVEGKEESYSMPKCACPEGNWIGGCNGGQDLCGRVPVCEVEGGEGEGERRVMCVRMRKLYNVV